MTKNRFEQVAEEIGKIVSLKNASYGNSFADCGRFLELLYPNGITPDQYTDVLLLTRIFDKLKRAATSKDFNGESPYLDICGYAILGVVNDAELKTLLEITDNAKK